NFERRDPNAAHLEHVIDPSAIAIATIGLAKVFVTSVGPLTHERATVLRPLIPVAFGGGRPADDELANFAGVKHAAVFADNLCVMAAHGTSGCAVVNLAGPVAQKDVKHLGRADAVKDIDPHLGAPLLADVRRQRFAGRYALP